MKKNIIIRKSSLKKWELRKIMKVIHKTFFTINQKDCDDKLCQKLERIYWKNANIEFTRKRILKANILLIAKDNGKIIGTMRGGGRVYK